MAQSVTLTANGVRGYSLRAVFTETGTSIENNTSTVSYTLQIVSGTYSYTQYGTGWTIKVNGSTVSYMRDNGIDTTMSSNSTLTLASGTTTVQHDNNGKKTVSVSAYISIPEGNYGPGDMSASGSLVLSDIPRASSLTIPTLTIGEAATLTITAADPSFSHKITYAYKDLSGTIATLAAGASSTSWTPPTSFYAKMPNAVQDNITITLETSNNGTVVGSNTYTVPVNVPTSIRPSAPSVTLTPVNTNAWINTKGLYVGGYSKVQVQSSASPGSGATLSSYVISGAVSGTGSNYTSGVLTDGAKSITVTATDSRGRSNSTTVSCTFLAYSNPMLTTFSAERGTYAGGSWTSDVAGDHIRLTAIASVSLSAEGNAGTITAEINGNSPDVTSGNYFIWTSTNSSTSYAVEGSVTDSVGNSTSRTVTATTIEVPFNINVDLPGAAFGMVAQDPGVVELSPAWGLKFQASDASATVIPDPDKPNKILGMRSDGLGVEWKPGQVGGGLFDAEYDPDTGEITIWADFATTVTFSYDDPTSILTIGEDNDSVFLDKVYPVGSIYMSIVDVNPSALFGGTWEKIEGQFLLGSSVSYPLGSTGGSATVALTESEMPSHAGHLPTTEGEHSSVTGTASGKYLATTNMSSYGSTGRGWNAFSSNEAIPAGMARGSGTAHENMPPYLAVNIYKRTA